MLYSKNIWIVDFGSQYTQLITRKSRELGFSSVVITVEEAKNRFKKNELPKCLILSGGPQSVFEDDEDYSDFFKNEKLPILGICYGMQLIAKYFGGVVQKGVVGEYGHQDISIVAEKLKPILSQTTTVWMSHSDHVSILPKDFDVSMKSTNHLIAGIEHKKRAVWGIQFHPEVEHTHHGIELLNYYFLEIAKLQKDWTSSEMLAEALEPINNVKNEMVLCAFSGGVDSLVAATLSAKILGKNLYCFFVDNGLLRFQDLEHIEMLKRETNLNIEIIDAKEDFLKELQNVTDPEEKRKTIGRVFIEVFEKKVAEYQNNKKIKFTVLLQGTLYPDVIESLSPHGKNGKSVTIKSHHNVGGLPERMKLKLLEPFRTFFKDEVRQIGRELNIKPAWIDRHPFPGPGLGVRVLGAISEENLKIVKLADQILFEELIRSNQYLKTWQAFTVFLPVKTVGVKGDGRVYENVICLRMVDSSDGMTAECSEFSFDFLKLVSRRITNEVKGVTRVVYDITSKPPGTIEWE